MGNAASVFIHAQNLSHALFYLAIYRVLWIHLLHIALGVYVGDLFAREVHFTATIPLVGVLIYRGTIWNVMALTNDQ